MSDARSDAVIDAVKEAMSSMDAALVRDVRALPFPRAEIEAAIAYAEEQERHFIRTKPAWRAESELQLWGLEGLRKQLRDYVDVDPEDRARVASMNRAYANALGTGAAAAGGSAGNRTAEHVIGEYLDLLTKYQERRWGSAARGR